MGGRTDEGLSDLSNVEVFPPPPSGSCSIPELPEPRKGHSLSLLTDGRLVVCGGQPATSFNTFDSCISWIAGNSSWTLLHKMR